MLLLLSAGGGDGLVHQQMETEMTAALAMHMPNVLLSPSVAAVTLVAAVAVLLLAARTAKTAGGRKLPLMGVMGAFVFAAQMINFPIVPGVSGHLSGGVLLAILLGPSAAIVTMAAILIIQCLLFQDGGLLALGCNIINMGVVPCLLGWWIYRAVAGQGGRRRLFLAACVACVVGVTAGAVLVPLQSYVSGVLRIPLLHFLVAMVAFHLAIGFVEGLITFAVVAYLRRVRPASVSAEAGPVRTGRPRRALAVVLVAALLLAGVVSWFASPHPDALESSSEGHIKEPSGTIVAVDEGQARWAPMSDYTRREAPLGQLRSDEAEEQAEAAYPNVDGWGSLAGVVGTVLTLGIVYLLAVMLKKRNGGCVNS